LKRAAGAAIAIVAMASASPAMAARDEHIWLPIQPALEKGQSYRTKVELDVRLFFGSGKTPGIARRMSTFSANAKSNAVGKSDQEACDIAFLTAVAGLQEHARREGGNAVIDIKSVYRGENSSSATDYVCGAGNIMVGVTLEGTVVRLK
jgi:uncharacterized protein YbjQ (UPF0145 family)